MSYPPIQITDPADQFQVGDKVTYMPEGVLAEVTGYLWANSIDGVHRIGGYELDIGITVPGQLIERRK